MAIRIEREWIIRVGRSVDGEDLYYRWGEAATDAEHAGRYNDRYDVEHVFTKLTEDADSLGMLSAFQEHAEIVAVARIVITPPAEVVPPDMTPEQLVQMLGLPSSWLGAVGEPVRADDPWKGE